MQIFIYLFLFGGGGFWLVWSTFPAIWLYLLLLSKKRDRKKKIYEILSFLFMFKSKKQVGMFL